MRLWRRKPRRYVAIRATAPGRPDCTLSLRNMELFLLGPEEAGAVPMPIWDMFWPPPEPESSGARYEFVIRELPR